MNERENDLRYRDDLKRLESKPTDRALGLDTGTYDHERIWAIRVAVVVARAYYMAKNSY